MRKQSSNYFTRSHYFSGLSHTRDSVLVLSLNWLLRYIESCFLHLKNRDYSWVLLVLRNRNLGKAHWEKRSLLGGHVLVMEALARARSPLPSELWGVSQSVLPQALLRAHAQSLHHEVSLFIHPFSISFTRKCLLLLKCISLNSWKWITLIGRSTFLHSRPQVGSRSFSRLAVVQSGAHAQFRQFWVGDQNPVVPTWAAVALGRLG